MVLGDSAFPLSHQMPCFHPVLLPSKPVQSEGLKEEAGRSLQPSVWVWGPSVRQESPHRLPSPLSWAARLILREKALSAPGTIWSSEAKVCPSGVQARVGREPPGTGQGVAAQPACPHVPSRGPVQQAGRLLRLHPERDEAWRLVVDLGAGLEAVVPRGGGEAVKGVEVRPWGGGHPHEASHVAVRGVGVRRHARGGDALRRHQAGPGGAPGRGAGPQGVLQLQEKAGP